MNQAVNDLVQNLQWSLTLQYTDCNSNATTITILRSNWQGRASVLDSVQTTGATSGKGKSPVQLGKS